MERIALYRELHPATAEFTLFSSAHGTFSKIDRSHVTAQTKSLQVQEIRNHIKRLLGSQWHGTRNQVQPEHSKTFGTMEAKEHAIEQ